MSDLVPNNNNQSFQSLGDLDLSDYKALIEEAQQRSTSLASSEEVEVVLGNNLWRAHVTAQLGSSERIKWGYALTKKEKASLSADEIYEEVSSTAPEHYFVGLRGIVLQVNYGLELGNYDASNDTWTSYCKTTMLENEMTGQVITSDQPLEVPIERPYLSKTKAPHKQHLWLEKHPYVKLYGSRPPVGMPEDAKTNRVRSCAECVAAGEHYIGSMEDFMKTGENAPKLPTCGMTGSILFCVFQVGILDSSQVLSGPNGKARVKWVDVQDAHLTAKRPDGTYFERTSPFILKIDRLNAGQHNSLGTNTDKYEIDIVTSGKNCYLPDGAKLYSWGDYFRKYLHAKNVTSTPRKLDLKGTTVYPVVTDLLLARRKKDSGKHTHVAVYTPVLDQNIIDRGEGLDQFSWLQAALQCLQIEEAIAKGEMIQGAPTALPGKAPSPALKESTTVESATTPEEETTKPKSSFKAFVSPPEIN
jgi:hypothetical protein